MKKPVVAGVHKNNGIIAGIFTIYSHAFIGDAKNELSGGAPANEKNNPILAAASHVWPAAVSGDEGWQGETTRRVRNICFCHQA